MNSIEKDIKKLFYGYGRCHIHKVYNKDEFKKIQKSSEKIIKEHGIYGCLYPQVLWYEELKDGDKK